MGSFGAETLANATITYNGVQFGGSDAQYSSTPPQYSFSGQFIRDDAGRAIIGTQYTLRVQSIFYGSSETHMASHMSAIKLRLAAPRKSLKIAGLGTGFGTIANDVKYGPLPLDVQCNPLGQLAWEVVWQVQFTVTECASTGTAARALMAFNFATTFDNDFEGVTVRTISGYAEIAQRPNAGGAVATIADQVRDNLTILCPQGFRRVQNSWQNNAAHDRVDFSIVDERLPGAVPPPGIIQADGDGEFTAGDGKGGFASGTYAMSVRYRIAPGTQAAPYVGQRAAQLFLSAITSKQSTLNRGLAGDGGGFALPLSIRMRQGQYDGVREFSGSCAWRLTGCLNKIMKASAIWEQLTPSDYTRWRTSVANLWGNRGESGIRELAEECAIIDLCSNTVQKTIGGTPVAQPYDATGQIGSLTCEKPPADGGWISHELEVRILRKDSSWWHKLTSVFSVSPTTSTATTTGMQVGGGSYGQSASEQDSAEKAGFPDVFIGVRFKAARMVHKPEFPELVSVAGLKPTLVQQDVPAPKLLTTVFTCPVWSIAGYRIYRVSGYVPEVKATGSEVSCGQKINSKGGLKL